MESWFDMQVAIGIDPGGSSGAIAVVEYSTGTPIALSSFKERWWGTQLDLLRTVEKEAEIKVVTIEQVQAMGAGKNGRRQGASSAFSFGANFGWCHGVVRALGVYDENVLCPFPQEWQKWMGCLSSGDKSVGHALAMRLFPGLKISKSSADALILAEYGRLIFLQRDCLESFESLLEKRLSKGLGTSR